MIDGITNINLSSLLKSQLTEPVVFLAFHNEMFTADVKSFAWEISTKT